MDNQNSASEKAVVPVITISRQFGSDGYAIGKKLAEDFKIDIFDREIIQDIAENTNRRTAAIETLDERGISSLEDMLHAISEKQHLWAYEYLKNLTDVVGTIAEHGPAVIVGRGANFILPREQTLKVRIVAPLKMRIKAVEAKLNISVREAEKLIIKSDSDKAAFIRKYFNTDINELLHYDLVINRERFSVEAAAHIIAETVKDGLDTRKSPSTGRDDSHAVTATASM